MVVFSVPVESWRGYAGDREPRGLDLGELCRLTSDIFFNNNQGAFIVKRLLRTHAIITYAVRVTLVDEKYTSNVVSVGFKCRRTHIRHFLPDRCMCVYFFFGRAASRRLAFSALTEERITDKIIR